ncbi:MAG: nucleoside triphosphate pyrophosphohydrolase [Longimicrobiales bacterium]
MPDTSSVPVLDRATALVRFLRANCSWDAAQTPASLVPYLLEEAHEVAHAIAKHDETGLADELGDLLLNVAFQLVLAEERKTFTAETVVSGLEQKMRRRHPHLYGDGPPEPWEALKAKERSNHDPAASLLDGIAPGLDALSRAQRIQDRASGVGFDWKEPRGAFDKIREEVDEVGAHLHGPADTHALEEELGDLLFSVVNLTRLTGGHALNALQRANAKFERRFRSLETEARKRNLALENTSLEDMDRLWDEVKRKET